MNLVFAQHTMMMSFSHYFALFSTTFMCCLPERPYDVNETSNGSKFNKIMAN